MGNLAIIAYLLVVIGGVVVWFGEMWHFGALDRIEKLNLTVEEIKEFMKGSNITEMIGFIMIGIGILLLIIAY